MTQETAVTMYAPEGATELSFDGVTYEVKDGAVDVPTAAVADLLAHGYTLIGAIPAKETEAPQIQGDEPDRIKAEQEAEAARLSEERKRIEAEREELERQRQEFEQMKADAAKPDSSQEPAQVPAPQQIPEVKKVGRPAKGQ